MLPCPLPPKPDRRFSTSRVHSLYAGSAILFGLRLYARRLAKTADRTEFTVPACLGGLCYGLVVRFPLLSTRRFRSDAVTFRFWLFSVGQVRDLHPPVPVRSQAHERRFSTGLAAADMASKPVENQRSVTKPAAKQPTTAKP